VLNHLSASLENGLVSTDVEKRRERFGKNELPADPGTLVGNVVC
jgi:hypothetical protein